MDKFIENKITVTYMNLKDLSYSTVSEIPELLYEACGYKMGENCPNTVEGWSVFGRDDRIKGKDKHGWFYADITTPKTENGEQIELEFRTGLEEKGIWDALNPQGLLYLNGKVVQGIDMNHYTAVVEPDTEYKMFVYFYTGMNDCDVTFRININKVDLRIRELYYDLKVAMDAAECYAEDDYTFMKTAKVLEQVCNRIDFRNPMSEEFYASIADAKEYMQKEYYEKICGNSDAIVSYIGHTHIDIA